MGTFIESYLGLEIVIVIIAVAVTLYIGKRRLRSRQTGVPQGFVKTDEIFVDPTTGIRQRVWFNPNTGQRFYEIVKTN